MSRCRAFACAAVAWILGLALAGCAGAPVNPVESAWTPGESWWQAAVVSGGHLEAADGSKRFVGASHAKNLHEAAREVGKRSPIAAALALVDAPGPNAYAAVVNGRPVIAVTLGFLDLLGGDRDALATTLGHELAHLHFGHSETRRERHQTAQGASRILGTLLGLAGVPMGGTLANVGVTAVVRSFTRDEERAADAQGLEWATAAGFSACGSARTVRALQASGGGAVIPFLATHPGDDERVERANEVSLRLTGKAC